MPASRFRRAALAVVGLAILAIAFAPAADATFSVYIVGCTRKDGSSCFQPAGSGVVYGSAVPPLYTGTTITLRIYADPGINAGCPPTHVSWGDGTTTSASTSPGDHHHTYNAAGTYTILESDSCGHSGSTDAEISPGGAGLDLNMGFLDPVFTGLFALASAAGLAFAFAPIRFPPGFSAPREPTQAAHVAGAPRPQLATPASHAENMMSLADIPQGAYRFPDQWLETSPGTPADPFTKLVCPACHFPVGYTTAGWYCRNPACPLINSKDPASYFNPPGGNFGMPSVSTQGP
jgi:hypothetical protein